MKLVRKYLFEALLILFCIFFTINFIESKFQNHNIPLSSDNLLTFNGNCPHSVGESILFIRYKQIFFNASPYIDQISEFEGELDNCKNKVVGSNYDQNENITQITKINLIVEETQDYKLFYIIKAFWVPIVFSGTLSIVFYKVINKNSAALIFVAFLFIITFGLDNFYKGINFSNSNYLSSVQPYRELQSVFDNKTIYHSGFVDEEKLGGISKAKLIYSPDLVADIEVSSDIQIFIEYQIETLINQPNYEQRYNSRNNINTERLRIVVEEPTSSDKFITFFNPNENTLYFLNYDD